MAHTLGPWSAHPTFGKMESEYFQPFGVLAGDTLVAGCFGDTAGGELAALANAKLTAAAPDLLVVAEYAVGILQDVFRGAVDPVTALDAINDLAVPAIAKARGSL